jgi:hypothetical protein
MPRIRPPALATRQMPATVTDLLAQCVVQAKPKLIDEVVKVFIVLYEDATFRALRGEEDPDKYVEGSESCDDTVAAQMVREKGIEMGMSLIKNATLHDICIKLRGAERRYNSSRKQRGGASTPPTTPAAAAQESEAA